jgi:hypothetical protein
VDHPNRNPDAAERLTKVTIGWSPSGGAVPEHGQAQHSEDLTYGGAAGSLRFSLPAGVGERQCLYELGMGAQYETFPLLTRPVVRLAVHAGPGLGMEGQAVIAFTLSEQPPDLASNF